MESLFDRNKIIVWYAKMLIEVNVRGSKILKLSLAYHWPTMWAVSEGREQGLSDSLLRRRTNRSKMNFKSFYAHKSFDPNY